MSLTYIGELSIGAVLPLPVSLVGTAQADLEAKLAALVEMQAQLALPPSPITALIALAEQTLDSLKQLLLQGIPVPSASLQIVAILAAVATLTLQLAPYLAFGELMGTGGVFGYVYDGNTNGAGAALTTALAGGFPGHGATDHADMLVLGCTASATWTAIQAVFKTAP